MALARGALSKHGFPRGFRYTPKHEELIDLLADRLRGRPMAPQVDRVFNHIRILDYHPQQLYDRYRAFAEAGCIYFFSQRESAPSASGTKKKASAAPAEGKKWRPTRTVNGGGWKPSGGAKDVKRPENEGGAVVGRMVTMVFYDRRREGGEDMQIKTHWGLHEFTVLLGPQKYSKLAVYRLYKVKSGGANKGGNRQANVPPVHRVANVAVQQQNPSTSSVAAAATTSCSVRTFASAQAFAAASTSTSTSQEQKPLVSTGQVQKYHNQYVFGTAAMPPPQHGIWAPPPATVILPVPGYFQFAAQSEHRTAVIPPPVPVAGVPDYFQFAVQSRQRTVPLAAMNIGEQQSPATPASADQFGVTPSPPASASSVADQSAPAAMMSPPHAEFSGRDEMVEAASQLLEVAPPPPQLVLPPRDYDMDAMLSASSAEVPASFNPFADIFPSDGGDVFFSLDELAGTDYPFGGDVNNNQADGEQEPPSAAF